MICHRLLVTLIAICLVHYAKTQWRRATKPPPKLYEVIEAKDKHTGTVIFLHRAGCDGKMTKDWLTLLLGDHQMPHLRVIFPTASLKPYSVLENRTCNIWFDQHEFTFETKEILDSFVETQGQLEYLIRKEEEEFGIKPDRIAIGGFSTGGQMALHAGLRLMPDKVAAVFSISAFLPRNSCVYDFLDRESNLHKFPKIFISTGADDEFVLERWVRQTVGRLRQYNLKVVYQVMPEVLHSINGPQLATIWSWLERRIPKRILNGSTTYESDLHDNDEDFWRGITSTTPVPDFD